MKWNPMKWNRLRRVRTRLPWRGGESYTLSDAMGKGRFASRDRARLHFEEHQVHHVGAGGSRAEEAALCREERVGVVVRQSAGCVRAPRRGPRDASAIGEGARRVGGSVAAVGARREQDGVVAPASSIAAASASSCERPPTPAPRTVTVVSPPASRHVGALAGASERASAASRRPAMRASPCSIALTTTGCSCCARAAAPAARSASPSDATIVACTRAKPGSPASATPRARRVRRLRGVRARAGERARAARALRVRRAHRRTWRGRVYTGPTRSRRARRRARRRRSAPRCAWRPPRAPGARPPPRPGACGRCSARGCRRRSE